MSYPNIDDRVVHQPSGVSFAVTRRTRHRESGLVELWNGDDRFPADECTIAPVITPYEIGSIVQNLTTKMRVVDCCDRMGQWFYRLEAIANEASWTTEDGWIPHCWLWPI